MSHWHGHRTSLLVPSLGLEDVVWHMEGLINYVVNALSDTLQQRMALDAAAAALGRAYASAETEGCTDMPDDHRIFLVKLLDWEIFLLPKDSCLGFFFFLLH